MRISDWSSDVCSSDLNRLDPLHGAQPRLRLQRCLPGPGSHLLGCFGRASPGARPTLNPQPQLNRPRQKSNKQTDNQNPKETYMIKLTPLSALRSEEHTSELQSLMRISYAVFCLKKKK